MFPKSCCKNGRPACPRSGSTWPTAGRRNKLLRMSGGGGKSSWLWSAGRNAILKDTLYAFISDISIWLLGIVRLGVHEDFFTWNNFKENYWWKLWRLRSHNASNVFLEVFSPCTWKWDEMVTRLLNQSDQAFHLLAQQFQLPEAIPVKSNVISDLNRAHASNLMGHTTSYIHHSIFSYIFS